MSRVLPILMLLCAVAVHAETKNYYAYFSYDSPTQFSGHYSEHSCITSSSHALSSFHDADVRPDLPFDFWTDGVPLPIYLYFEPGEFPPPYPISSGMMIGWLRNGSWTTKRSTYVLGQSLIGWARYKGTRMNTTSVLSPDGVITTIENIDFYLDGMHFSGRRSQQINLNTGHYTYTDTSVDHSSSVLIDGVVVPCPGFFQVSIDAILPIHLAPQPASGVPPTRLSIDAVDPLAPAFLRRQALPVSVDTTTVLAAPSASGLTADGKSAVPLIVRSDSAAPVTFAVSPSDSSVSPPYGALTPFLSTYPWISAPSGSTQTTINVPSFCDVDGKNCVFLALLWAPQKMPVSAADLDAGTLREVALDVTATQGALMRQTGVNLQPPPLLLIHGLWSNAAAWEPFRTWLASSYPRQSVFALNYGDRSDKSFRDDEIRNRLSARTADVLATAAANGVAARQVDIVAHSMGGLIARNFMTQNSPPVRELITIGTPHLGTPMAEKLITFKDALPTNPLLSILCSAWVASPCTLSRFFATVLKRPIDGGGVADLQNGLGADTTHYRAIGAVDPASSVTKTWLNSLIGGYIPGQTVDSILGATHDTIVPLGSQQNGASEIATVTGVVHAAAPTTTDIDEVRSNAVWTATRDWLFGNHVEQSTAAAFATTALPSLDLTGFTEVPPSEFNVSPADGTALTIGALSTLTAVPANRTLSQFLLLQKVADPQDAPLLYAIQTPFAISFMPRRLGAADFIAVAMFTDRTYATMKLHYPLQPDGDATSLDLDGGPTAPMTIGSSVEIGVAAHFGNGPIDVTRVAAYAVRSGTSNVISVTPSGKITAIGNGVDWVDVSYGGATAAAKIEAGACDYDVTPSTQAIDGDGGSVTFNVAATSGCNWIAGASASWVSLTKTNTALAIAAPVNTTGSPRMATIEIGDRQVIVTQPASGCSYDVAVTQVAIPASGGSGTIAVTTTCEIVPTVSQTWLSVFATDGAIIYSATANTDSSSRAATIMAGTRPIAVSQEAMALTPPAFDIQPQGALIPVGSKSSLGALALGSAPRYQWYIGTRGVTTNPVAGATSNTYSTPALSATTSYWLRAMNDAGSADSNTATIKVYVPFTDDTLVGGTTIVRAVHVADLRARIDALRARWALPSFAWTDAVLTQRTTRIRAQHLLELRNALGDVYRTAMVTPPLFADSAVTTIRAVHLRELRAAVIAME